MNELLLSYFASGMMLMMPLIGLVYVIVLPILNRFSKRFFIILFSVLILSILSFIFDLMTYQNPTQAQASRIIIFFEYLFPSVLISLPTVYLLDCSKEDWRRSRLLYSTVAIWLLFFVLLIVNQFSSFFYYVTPDNHPTRGPLFPLLLIPIIVIIALNLLGVIRRRRSLSKKMLVAFLIYMCPFLASIIIHMFIPVYIFIDISIFLSTLAMFIIILSDQIEQNQRQQKEIARQRANIMVLQMRPHFIYNSLTTIYYLCDQAPEKAQQVIMDFTLYLRKNFNAISKDDMIPFLEELDHTSAYLAVEKALHEDLLFVDYDTPHTRFRVPPLTLQPIVENAIKHSLDPDAEPLHIFIKTSKTDYGTLIKVEDDGIGFNPKDDSKTHPALINIQERLNMMCNGTMTITPRKEGGTVVEITIPSNDI